MTKKITLLPLLFLLAALPGCDKTPEIGTGKSLTYKSSQYEGRLVHEWMALGYGIVKENSLEFPQAARIFGYLGLTAWEAACHGVPNGRSMSGQINDFTTDDFDPDRVYDWGIVLSSAMQTVFPQIVEGINNAQRSQLEILAAVQEDQMMQKGLSEQIRQDSRFLGGRIGARIVERVRRDGRDVIRNIVPVIPARDTDHPWYWDPGTLGQTPVEPLWSTIRTFVTENVQVCEPILPLPYSIAPGTSFYDAAKDVFDIERSTANKANAYHWEDGPGRTSTAAGHWVRIAKQLLERESSNMAISAKAYCLVGIAVADGASASWYAKYKYFLQRPVTFIREQMDPTWTPLIHTPAHPSYTPCTSVLAGACPEMLIEVLGDIGFVDRTQLGSPLFTPEGGPFVLPERTFGSLTLAGNEAALSPLHAGTAFRLGCEEGQKTGKCIATTILARLDFGI
ncbi:MAG: vanadium-dependent haloperoxidase [Saprospiraceae bacterium]